MYISRANLVRGLVTTLLLASQAHASEILLPGIAAKLTGANDVSWATEVRATNLTDQPRTFSVVDWIGSSCWNPSSFTLRPHETRSIGGYEIFRGVPEIAPYIFDLSCPRVLDYFGAAVLEVDDGIVIQSALLVDQAIPPLSGFGALRVCKPWEGGFVAFLDFGARCNRGAGPVTTHQDSFRPRGSTFLLPWLHTSTDRRTNIVFVNPEPFEALVSVVMTSASGETTVSLDLRVPSHSYFQLSDVFGTAPWSVIRDANRESSAVAARATITSDNARLYSAAYVASNLNNTVSVSLPMSSH